jgi:hypothetical protein
MMSGGPIDGHELDNVALKNPETVQRPRSQIRLLHFFVLTAAVAFTFFAHERGGSGVGLNPKPLFWKAMFQASFVTSGSLWLFALVISFLDQIRQKKILAHPGHLIIAVMGLATLLNELCLIAIGPRIPERGTSLPVDNEWAYAGVICQLAALVLSTLGILLGVWLYKWAWKITCLSLALFFAISIYFVAMQLFPSVSSSVSTISWLTKILNLAFYATLAMVLLCLILDLGSSKKRDVWHWVGGFGYLIATIWPNILVLIAVRYLSFNELFGG